MNEGRLSLTSQASTFSSQTDYSNEKIGLEPQINPFLVENISQG